MKTNIQNIGGEIIKDNETYVLKDNRLLKNLVLSSTSLHAMQSTRGHSHPGQEEVYYFVGGHGKMELDDDKFDVGPGDVVLIKDGVFHRVHNTTDQELYFVCIFDGSRNH